VGFAGTVVVFFVGILLIVMIHEFGHYVPARRFGFRVLEFFVGFGPRLWSFRKGEIEYGVKAIPAGGYVKIAGMNPLVDDVPPGDEDRAYYAKPVWQRAVVIACGPLSHFLVAAAIFAVSIAIWGDPDVTAVGTVEDEVSGGPAPAAIAGLLPGDVIVEAGGFEEPSPPDIRAANLAADGGPVTYVVERDGELLRFEVTPVIEVRDGEEVPRIGIILDAQNVGPIEAIPRGIATTVRLTWESFGQIGNIFGPEGIVRTVDLLFTEEQRANTDAVSVVGIGQQVGTLGEQGEWEALLWSFAYVVLFIGIINLIPLPPLDGGHLAVLLIEKVTGKPVDMRKLIPVSVSVLAFLVLFTLANVTLDITKPIPGP
jgi:membrane-associated protease RseP (regulator of RpoE activity)